MSSIRAGTGLRKVKDTEKRDRSAVGATASSADNSSAPSPGPGAGGMMGAIQEALNKRKAKVSGSGMLYYPLLLFCLCGPLKTC